jgi:hypothetical protein
MQGGYHVGYATNQQIDTNRVNGLGTKKIEDLPAIYGNVYGRNDDKP